MNRESYKDVLECSDTTNKEVDIIWVGLVTISLRSKTKRLWLCQLISGMYLKFVLVTLLSCNNV